MAWLEDLEITSESNPSLEFDPSLGQTRVVCDQTIFPGFDRANFQNIRREYIEAGLTGIMIYTLSFVTVVLATIRDVRHSRLVQKHARRSRSRQSGKNPLVCCLQTWFHLALALALTLDLVDSVMLLSYVTNFCLAEHLRVVTWAGHIVADSIFFFLVTTTFVKWLRIVRKSAIELEESHHAHHHHSSSMMTLSRSKVLLGLTHVSQFSLAALTVCRGFSCRSTSDRMKIVKSVSYLLLRVFTSVSYVIFVTAMLGVGLYLKIYLREKVPESKGVQKSVNRVTLVLVLLMLSALSRALAVLPFYLQRKALLTDEKGLPQVGTVYRLFGTMLPQVGMTMCLLYLQSGKRASTSSRDVDRRYPYPRVGQENLVPQQDDLAMIDVEEIQEHVKLEDTCFSYHSTLERKP